MLKRLLLIFALLIPLLALSAVPVALAQAVAVDFIVTTRLPDSSDNKFPHVAASSSAVQVAGNANKADAYLWEKSASAVSFPSPQRLGNAGGKPDYSTANATYAADGTLYYFWTNIDQRRVYVRSRAAGATSFGPQYTVLGTSPFPAETDAAVRSDGTIFFFWREQTTEQVSKLLYRSSGDGGATWTSSQSIDDGPAIQPAVSAAAGPNGQVAVAYYKPGGSGKFQIYVSRWNGSGFTRENASSLDSNGSYGDPSIAITPAGQYIISYRGVEAGTDGIWYSERQADGSWPLSRLLKGKTSWTSISSDAYGNLHLFWLSSLSGGPRLYYYVKRAGAAFTGSAYDAYGGSIYHVSSTTSVSDKVYAHSVLEEFTGGDVNARYFLFSAGLVPLSAGAISIESGQLYTNKSALAVAFSTISGNPTQVRYRWGSPPTDADPYVTFANPLSVAAPTLPSPGACSAQTLYTQLRAGSALQPTPNQDSITFDRAVQATVSLVGAGGTLDPGFTPTLSATLKVDSPDECIGVSAAAVSGPISPASQSLALNGQEQYAKALSLTGAAGAKSVTVTVTDLLGNSSGALQRTVIYDPVKPVLNSTGAVTVTASPAGAVPNIFATIAISGANLTEAGGLYGLVIQNSFTPTGGSPLAGISPVTVPFSAMQGVSQSAGSVSLRLSWSLLSGIPAASQGPGTYGLTAYFIDKAGNRSAAVAAQKTGIVLGTLNRAEQELPAVLR